jgi:hypothetical protein
MGMLFDDDRKSVTLEEEIQIIEGVLKQVKLSYPHFKLRLIISGMKIVGQPDI